MKRIMQRYLMAHFLGPFFMALSFLTAFLLAFQMFEVIGKVVGKGVGAGRIFAMVGNIALSFTSLALPLSCFFAAFYIMGRLSEDSEVVAMRSFGMSYKGLFWPFALMGIFIAVAGLVLGVSTVPEAGRKFTLELRRISSQGILSEISAGQFYMGIPHTSIFVEKYQGQLMQGVMIEQQKKGQDKQILFAENGELIKHADSSVHIRLWPGNILRQQSGRWEKVDFQEYDFPLVDLAVSSRRERDSLISWGELWQRFKSRQGTPEQQRRTGIEIANRLKVPFECFIFLLVGFCLGIKKNRGRSKDTGATGLIFLALYFVLSFGLVSLGKRGFVHPFLVGILPVLVFATWGVRLFKRLDWQS